jgi:signal transduction histidine kinase
MCTALKEDTAVTQPAVSKSLGQMSGLLREAVAQTRYLARGLVPVGGEPDALQTGLAELAARTNGLGKVRCQLESRTVVTLDDPLVTGHLYRIAQEAVNNALKHAHASRITIRLEQKDGRLLLEVTDDGVGLPAARSGGVGLGLMHHRAGVIGAKLEIASGAKGGVTISCQLPLSR